MSDSLEQVIEAMRTASVRGSVMHDFADRLDNLVKADGRRPSGSGLSSEWPEVRGEDSISKLLADMEITPRTPGLIGQVSGAYFNTFIKRLRAMIENNDTEPEGPEIVPAGYMRDLPPDTLVVRVGEDGITPSHYYMPTKAREVAHERGRNTKYRVLYRAPEPPIKVGDELRTERDYNRAPVGTVARYTLGDRVTVKRFDGKWDSTGGRTNTPTNMAAFSDGSTVLYVPEEKK